MSKRQLQQHSQEQTILTDLQLSELMDHDENADLFEHLIEDFQDMMSDKQVLRGCIEKFIENLIDQFTLGIIFDLHRKYKTNAYCLEVEDSGDDEDSNETDVFQQINVKKNQDCVCPNCDRAVAASRFAPHLETCMGMGRISRSSRNASRRVASNKDKGDTSSYSGITSDDDDDVDWNSSERKRNRKKDKNGGKKNRGTPKKNLLEPEHVETLNVDIEGDDDELTSLRDMLHLQDRRSNSASPAEGAGASTTPKKRDKSKKKSKTKDRSSPSTSMSLD